MRIGILGSGQIGATLARLLTAAGHEVTLANRRGPASLTGLTAEREGGQHLNYQYLLDLGRPGAPHEERVALFVAGDDPEANGLVARLLDELGFAPVDNGPLAAGGRRQQPGTPVFNRPLRPGQVSPAP
ncbi:hypothetical protein SGLAM104S_01768 [Streptomyces glaucescens]